MFPAVFAAGFFVFSIYQRRWIAYESLTLAILAAVALAATARISNGMIRNCLATTGLLVCLLPIACFGWDATVTRLDEANVRRPTSAVAYTTWVKRMARILRNAKPNEQINVLCPPDFAPDIHYFGDLRSVASLFWQNAEGLRFYCDFFSATDSHSALQMARSRSIDFVIVPTDRHAAVYPLSLKFRDSFQPHPGGHLILNLCVGRPVQGLKPLPDLEAAVNAPLPIMDHLAPEDVRIFAVEPSIPRVVSENE